MAQSNDGIEWKGDRSVIRGNSAHFLVRRPVSSARDCVPRLRAYCFFVCYCSIRGRLFLAPCNYTSKRLDVFCTTVKYQGCGHSAPLPFLPLMAVNTTLGWFIPSLLTVRFTT